MAKSGPLQYGTQTVKQKIVAFIGLIVALITVNGFFPLLAHAATTGGVVSLTNSERAKHGLSALTIDARLTSSAQAKARDILANNYWSHNSPTGVNPWSFIKAAGYDYAYSGENLARGYTQDASIVAGWMSSPGHRANILSAQYTHIGIAIAYGSLQGKQTTVVVAHYAQPKTTHVSSQPVATTTPSGPKTSVVSQQTQLTQKSKPETTASVPGILSAQDHSQSTPRSDFLGKFIYPWINTILYRVVDLVSG